MRAPSSYVLLVLFVSLCGLRPWSAAAQEPHPHDDAHAHSVPEIIITADPLGYADGHFVAPSQVLDAEALRTRSLRSIGETVANELGVNASDFGASVGRPVIRGLGGARVRVLENGLGSFDLSTISADHAVSSEPIFARQVEILRGPATLLYGSGASGGLVNVVNGRISDTLPEGVEGGLYTHYDSASDGWLGGIEMDAAIGSALALHADALRRDTDDIDIPGFAETAPDEDESPGRLENSSAESDNFNVGASLIGEDGHLGFSVGYLDNNYGVPGAHGHHADEGHGEEHEEDEEGGTRIDIEQTRYDLAGSFDIERAHIHSVSARWGYNDYQHDEVEGSGEVGTRFSNEEWEGRVEVLLEPVGAWDIAIGGQFRDKDFSAVGAEAFVLPAALESQAGFIYGKGEFGDLHIDLGLRYESQDTAAKQSRARADFGLLSFSGGSVYNYASGYEIGMSYARSERAPGIEELFAAGPHLASNTYEIGDAGLEKEVSNNIDVFWRKTEGRYRLYATLFFNHVDDFVYLAANDLNGDGIADRVEDDFADTGEIVDEDDALLLVNQRQQGAEFWGFEIEGFMTVFDDARGQAELRVWTDYVSGSLDDGVEVPRLPPLRFGGSLDYRYGPWYARFAVTRVTDQDNAAPLETETHGYTMVDLDAGFVLSRAGFGEVTLFGRGTNLADETARRHTSFVKDLAPLPGRSWMVGARARF